MTKGVDVQDDERAAALFLQHGVNPSTLTAANPSSSQTVQSNKTVSQTPIAQAPSSSSATVKSQKGKEKEVVGNEEEREAGGSKGKKRVSAGGDGDQLTKKPKLVVDTSKGKEHKEKKNKGKERQGQEIEDEEEEGNTSPPGRKKRRTGPAGPGIASLKRADLIKKIRELEARIEVGEKEASEEEDGEGGGEIPAKAIESSKPLKSGLPPTKGSSKGKEKEEDSDDLSELEDSQVEEQIVEKILLRRSKSPSPIRSPIRSPATHTTHHNQRAVSADPLPLSHSLVRPSTSTSRRFSDQGGIALPVRSPQPRVEQAGPKEKEIVVAEKSIQAELGIVPR